MKSVNDLVGSIAFFKRSGESRILASPQCGMFMWNAVTIPTMFLTQDFVDRFIIFSVRGY